MTETSQSDENIITKRTVEIVEITKNGQLHEIKRIAIEHIMFSPDPTEWANALCFVTEQHQEERTENADLKIKITETPPAESEASDSAEVNINFTEGEGGVKVPGRFAGHLLDGCIAIGCAVSAGTTTKWVLESPTDALHNGKVLTVVLVQVIGIGVLAWRAMRRRP